MKKYEPSQIRKRELLFNNFLGGIAWGLGATIGVSVIIAILGIVGKQLGFIPFIGSFFAAVTDFIVKSTR